MVRLRWSWAPALLLALSGICASGCQARMFRQSPLWTPPAGTEEKVDPDRLNAWPLVYKNYDELTLFYFFVKDKDSVSLRPLFDWQKGKSLDILFPLARIRSEGGNSWAFPFMWGGTPDRKHFHVFPAYWSWAAADGSRSFRTLFPLYWDFKTKESQFGTVFPLAFWSKKWVASLFPLAVWKRDGSGMVSLLPPMRFGKDSGSILWPLLSWRRADKGWKFASFPFYRWEKDDYSYVMWPLYHRWRTDRGHGNLLPFPMVYWEKGKDQSRLFALPLLTYYERERGRRKIVSPAVIGQWDDEKKTAQAFVPPLLSYYGKDPESTTFANPLWGTKFGGQRKWVYATPLLSFWKRDGDRSSWFSPLYAGNREGDDSTQVIPPLLTFWQRRGDTRNWFSPFYAGSSSPEFARHVVPPLLTFYQREGKDSTWFSPVYAGARRGDAVTRVVPPLLTYYEKNSKTGDMILANPLFGRSRRGERKLDYVLPALTWWERDGKDSTWFSPLYAGARRGDAVTRVVPPLLSWYRRDSDAVSLASPLLGARVGKERSWAYALPLLSFYDRWEGDKRWFTPLYAGASNADYSAHVIPPLLSFRHRDHRNGDSTWFSPLYAGARRGSAVTRIIPPLFTFINRTDEETTWFTPIGGGRFSKEYASTTILPALFHYRREGDLKNVVSPLAIGHWSPDEGSVFIPPILGIWQRDAFATRWWSPLAAGYHSENDSWSYILPLAAFYRREGDVRRWYSPLFLSRSTPERSWTNVLGILYHGMHDKVNDETDGLFLAGLGGYHRSKDRSRTWAIPFFGHSYDKEHVSWTSVERERNSYSAAFLLFRRTAATRLVRKPEVEVPEQFRKEGSHDIDANKVKALKKDSENYAAWQAYLKKAGEWEKYRYHRFLPLYGYERTGDRESKFHLMFGLYRHHRVQVWDHEAKVMRERLERRVLGKLYHYRRTGKDVTVDVFPFITYDRTYDPDHGKDVKKVSFGWRLFRYERDGTYKKLHLLFIPIHRLFRWSKPNAPPAAAPAVPAVPAVPAAPKKAELIEA